MDAWLPVASLIFGYVGSLVTEVVRDRRARDRERNARESERQLERERQREATQRALLVDLQEALFELGRGLGRAHMEDEKAALKEGAEWGRQQLSEDVNQQIFEAERRALLLGVRLDDYELREKIKRFRDLAETLLTRTQSSKEAYETWAEAIPLHDEINERIGELLRALG